MRRISYGVLTLILGMTGCQTASNSKINSKAQEYAMVIDNNPLIQPFDGPYSGVPAFNSMKLADLKPAFRAGMADHLKNLEDISQSKEKPSFENTIFAMEQSNELMNRVYVYYGIWSSNKSSPEFREIAKSLSPEMSAYRAKIIQNKPLFERIAAVYDKRETLDPDQKRLTEMVYKQFVSGGAKLDANEQKRFAAINEELAKLQMQFGNNVLAEEENTVFFLSESELKGLPDSVIAGAKAAAEERGQPNKYAITNTRSSMDPFLTFSENRPLREKVWRAYYNRADNDNEYDNNKVIKNILKLRHERSQLLGYKNYAEWQLEDRMAETPARASDLMERVWPAAIKRVNEEVADMQALADKRGDNITIKPWDYRFYAEKVRLDRYDLNSNEVKQYLQLDKLREAMFYVAGRLFNYDFVPVKEGKVPVFHEDVEVFEVRNKKDNSLVGLWYLDPFARKGKRSGAWATSYRSYAKADGAEPVLSSNNSNFIETQDGKPVLISFDDATTFFHEFGHALHSLSSNVRYQSLNYGVRDYTEFQSQLLERWLLTDEVIDRFLVHYETGKPIPDSLVQKIKKAKTFNQGFSTTEYLASAIIDLELHSTDPSNIDPREFERETLKKMGMPDELVMRHRTPHFSHIFSSEGYAAGYYGYMWADVLTADATELFENAPGGFYDEELAQKMIDKLFAPRNALDPAEAYRAFRGGDADVSALMRARGFM